MHAVSNRLIHYFINFSTGQYGHTADQRRLSYISLWRWVCWCRDCCSKRDWYRMEICQKVSINNNTTNSFIYRFGMLDWLNKKAYFIVWNRSTRLQMFAIEFITCCGWGIASGSQWPETAYKTHIKSISMPVAVYPINGQWYKTNITLLSWIQIIK